MISLQPMTADAMGGRFDLAGLVQKKLGSLLKDGDVLVVSSKFVAISEGRIVELDSVNVGAYAKRLSSRYGVDPRLCELVVRESDSVIGGIPGFLLTLKDGLLAPNAGIDKSNIAHGEVVLYPRRPEESARRLREALQLSPGASVGVVVCDSRLAPTRRGTVGVAVAASGLEGIVDMRGKKDLFGNVLKVTAQAVADDLSSAAELVMGESDEGAPVVLVRGLSADLLTRAEYPTRRFSIAAKDCVYLRSFGYSDS